LLYRLFYPHRARVRLQQTAIRQHSWFGSQLQAFFNLTQPECLALEGSNPLAFLLLQGQGLLNRLSQPYTARMFGFKRQQSVSIPAFTVPRFGFTSFTILTGPVFSFRRQSVIIQSCVYSAKVRLYTGFPILTGPEFGFNKQQSSSFLLLQGQGLVLQAFLNSQCPCLVLDMLQFIGFHVFTRQGLPLPFLLSQSQGFASVQATVQLLQGQNLDFVQAKFR
jgi:hypothetical protein